MADPNSDRIFEPLAAYFSEIGSIPTLNREEQQCLAKELEAATHAFREALYRIPWTAEEVVRTWREQQGAGRTTRRLSEAFGTQSADVERQVDQALAEVERLMARRAGAAASERSAIDRKVSRRLLSADLSLELVRRLRRELLEKLETPGPAPRTLQKELGLPLRELRARVAEAEEAHVRMTAAKDSFVRHNLKLVVAVSKDFRGMGITFPDLIQEGNIGLVRAVEKFDWRRGFKFSTYAVWWIRQALIRAIQNHSRTIRIPSHQFDALRTFEEARGNLRRSLQREPSLAEVAKELEVPVERAEELASIVAEPVSLEADVFGEDRGRPRKLVDVVADPDGTLDLAGLDAPRVERLTRDSLSVLDEREQMILRWRFGLDGKVPRTLQEVGDALGLSRERARQLEMRALDRLRATARETGLQALSEVVESR